MKFDADLNKLWVYKLSKEVSQIKKDVFKNLHANIEDPLITVSNTTTLWGQWIPETREIQISINLLRNYEWKAVVHVLRHEFAHLIVSEVLKMATPGVSHGEAFATACTALGIDASRCASREYLATFKSSEPNGLVDKVRKLLSKGNCSSLNKEEADLFLNKAREIMVKHNIDMNNVNGHDRFWTVRPVGPLYKNVPSYVTTLRDIVEKFYFVKTIQTFGFVYEGGRRKFTRVVEMFGEKSNIELAEYVYHALLNNAEILWKEFVTEKKKTFGSIRGFYSKNNYILGLFVGYRDQLRTNEDKVTTPEMKALIHVGDPLLDELFNAQYPNLRYSRSYHSRRCGGFGDGVSAGKNMRIGRGVGEGESRGRLLTA